MTENNRINSTIFEETKEIVIVYGGDGKILTVNGTAIQKLGYKEEELLGLSVSNIFRREFQDENGEYLSFDREKFADKSETAMYRKNSSCFPVQVRFFDMDGETECLLAEDISWRNDMDVRIRQLKEEEEENSRVRNEFTANVTHELRTPVNGIKGHVNNLLEQIRDEEQRKILEVILFCCDNMSAIINNILDFSKLEAGKFTLEKAEFDFYKMMDQVIATHMAEINRKELGISVYIDKSIPQFLIGDALRINQILNNLLSNAIKFTLVGQISVDVSKTMQLNDAVELFFMVRDSGIGISKEEQDKLFQSFKQVDASITRRFGGTGLGLSITKQLVEMMNGTIHVDSEKGKGSCFSFSIKLHTSQNEYESSEIGSAYSKWSGITGEASDESQENFMEFGSENNRIELKKRMEKLVLSIELGSWEKAEMLAETIKALTQGAGEDMKRPILRLEMGIRKENYDKSMAAYEQLKDILREKLEN